MKKQWMACFLILGLAFSCHVFAEEVFVGEGDLPFSSSSDSEAASLDGTVTVEQATGEGTDTVFEPWDEGASPQGYAIAEDGDLENSLFSEGDILAQAGEDESLDAVFGEGDFLVEALPAEESFLSSDESDFVSESDVKEIVSSGKCGKTADWELDSNGVLTISGTGPMGDYSYRGISPFFANENIKSVVIEDGLITIGSYMFYGCSNLTSVTIPNSVTQIKAAAFDECINLRNITLPDRLESIGEDAFSGCTSLQNLVFPETLKSIGIAAFFNCFNMTIVSIPDSVTTLEDMAFFCCKNLKSVTIGNGLETICKCAFEECHSLKNLSIGSSVGVIEIKAFNECEKLTTVTIPASVKIIKNKAFGYRHKGFNIVKVSNMTIYGKAGSAAEQYAKDNGIQFQKMTDASGDEEGNDGQVTITKRPTYVKTSVNKNKVTVTWKAASKKVLKQIDRIQVEYDTDKSFTDPGTKIVGKEKTKATLKLDGGKKYYVRVRYVAEDGGVSEWSKVKKAKTE